MATDLLDNDMNDAPVAWCPVHLTAPHLCCPERKTGHRTARLRRADTQSRVA
jgi:hypothetical protein